MNIFNPCINTINAFFRIIRAIFQFLKKSMGDPPPLPAKRVPDTSPDIRIHPKTIVSTSHQNFNNSMKIAAENS